MKIHDEKAVKYIYSRSASIFASNPLGVFYPQTIEDIKNIIEYAKTHKTTLVFRGAGTSRSGQDTNDGIIVDMTKHFNKILDFNSEKKEITVQAGTTLKQVNDFLKKRGLFFPPDPSSGDYCTLGGMCANNSGGPRALKYGVTRDYVISLKVVLENKEFIDFSKKEEKFEELKEYLLKNKNIIEKYYPKTTKNSSGYNLKDIFNTDNTINWHKLFVSSEGTLGAITEITLKVLPVPSYKEEFLIKAQNMKQVTKLVSEIKKLNPEKIELMDKDILFLSGIKNTVTQMIINSDYQYILLVSFTHDNKDSIKEKRKNFPELFKENLIILENKEEYSKLFKLRKTAAGYIHRQRNQKKPIPVIEDLQIDFQKFEIFRKGIDKILKKYNVKAFLFGHIGDGNIHINTFFDIKKTQDRITAKNLKRETHKFIYSIGGNLSGEHGDGKLRSPDLEIMYPKLYHIFQKIKTFFDKDNIFNKDNIIIKDFSKNHFDNLRLNPVDEYDFNLYNTELIKNKYYRAEIEACNGCGKCRDYCPSFKAYGDERYTTRARLTLLQGLLNQDFTLSEFENDKSIKETINTCIGCHICSTQCPTGVDAGKLIFKLKEALENEYNKIDEIIRNNHLIGKIGQTTSFVSNLLLNSDITKTINKKFLGFSDKIDLPKFNKINFNIEDYLYTVETLPENAIVYFSGCFANFYDTENEFGATVKILEYLGFNPALLDFRCCGITKLNKGIPIKKDAHHNIEIFKKLIKLNIPIITTSPSCRHTLVDLYPFLNLEWKGLNLKDNIHDIFTFLKNNEVLIEKLKHNKKKLPKLQYHTPCHTLSTTISEDIEHVLKKLGYEIIMLPQNCCGMAGTFGIYEKNLEKSLKIGKEQFKAINENKVSVITECGTCQLQINNHTEQKAVHPVKYVYDLIKDKI